MQATDPTSSLLVTRNTTRERFTARCSAPPVSAAASRTQNGMSGRSLATLSGAPRPIAFVSQESATCGNASAQHSRAQPRRSRSVRCLAPDRLVLLVRASGAVAAPLTWATASAISGAALTILFERWHCRFHTSNRLARAWALARRTPWLRVARGAITQACARTWKRCKSS